jgi:hypothetical protein
MADGEDRPAAANASREVKLPPFWPARPAAWFSLAESRFRLRGVDDTQSRFDHLLSSLPDDIIASVLDVVETAQEDDDPYQHLKDRLLETHSLSNFEKLDALFRVAPLGGRKPSQLLSEMLQVCPTGEEDGIFFHYLFLQRLPSHLRAMLGDVEEGDPRALAAKADKLLSMNPTPSGFVAAVAEPDPDPNTVAVVSSNSSRGRGGRPGQQKNRGGQKGGKTDRNTPVSLAQESSGLCKYHWTYGDKAHRCVTPCSWQGN